MGACSTVYVAEICSVENRCFLLSVLEIYFSLGILVSYISTCYLRWNLAALIFTCISLFSLFLLAFIPETPYWLLRKKRIANAILAFAQLRGNMKGTQFEEEFKSIVLATEEDEVEESCDRNCFLILCDNFKPFVIMVTFHVLLQGTGYTILITFFEDFLKELHIPLYSEMIAIGFPAASLVASFFTPLSVNYWQRRETTMLSGAGMMVSLGVLGCYYSYAEENLLKQFWTVVPVCYYLFVTSCTIGVLTLSQCMIGELFPTEVRGMMCGITEAAGNVLSGLSVFLYPMLGASFPKSRLLYFFSAFGLLTMLFGKFLLPETYGKTLDEIQNQYFKKSRRRTFSEKNGKGSSHV